MKEIVFFQTANGRSPVEDFLDSLSGNQAKKVAWVLKLIENLQSVPSKYLKALVNTSGIIEVRVEFGKEIFRILGFIFDKNKVILTNGFKKKTQKTPANEIHIAEQRKQEYLNRRQQQ